MLKIYEERFPNVEIHLEQMSTKEQIAALEKRYTNWYFTWSY
ncbi:hypothetical protein [Virgibacillus pantothenticus]|nr:hypothetical protein [Virgibacillus pantothenticus]